MKNKILLIAGNYFPEPTGIGRYNGEMMDWLADNGYECTVITTYPYYPYWKVQPPYHKKNRWFKKEIKITPGNNKITVYRCPHYVALDPSVKNRILFDFSFSVSAAIKLATLIGKKYDFVMNVTPPLALGLLAAFYKKVSGALFIYHIQDLQVDAAHGLNMLASKKFIKLLLKTESFILKKADRISTISQGMQQKIALKINTKIFLFPNWADTKNFFPIQNKACLKESFGFKPDIPLVLYSGAIGKKQGLESILCVAKCFQDESKQLHFVICGSGPYKGVLQEKAAELNLQNISFMSLQPNDKLNTFLNMADVHLVIQKAGAADLVMPSKLANILSVGGLAVVTANTGSGLYDIISTHNIGLLCVAEDTSALKNSIELAVKTDCTDIRLSARGYAEKYLSVDKIMQQYVAEVIC